MLFTSIILCSQRATAHTHTHTGVTIDEYVLCFQVSCVSVLSNTRTGGGEQVLWVRRAGGKCSPSSAGSFYLFLLSLFCVEAFPLSSVRTCGFVWSAATSVVVATLAGMPTSTLRKHSIRTLCSSPTTESGTTQEVLHSLVCVCVQCWQLRMEIVNDKTESCPRIYEAALIHFSH